MKKINKETVNIYWFKKDLRLFDNEALEQAVNDNKPLILLYIYEPELWLQDDSSFRHFKFIQETVNELENLCLKHKLILNIFQAEAIEILTFINDKYRVNAIFSHQETGNMWSYKRDIKLAAWCQEKQIIWHEIAQHGVVRALKDRDGWSNKWYQKMSQKLVNNSLNFPTIRVKDNDEILAQNLDLEFDKIEEVQIGGRELALANLRSFFKDRGENYSKEMSSPVTAGTACSRISPYLTYGCLSIREIYQYAESQKKQLRYRNNSSLWLRSINSFTGRLRWHCHFMQKLEDEPEIEFKAMHPAYEELDRGYNEEYFNAWASGNTGFTMIDAVMRALIKHGWINFRMRAMLVSFATNHLWLDWRIIAKYLARLFIDYEPGIHYSQIQMQAAITGINAIRIYNPVKQATDQDKEGKFIRKYIPELKDVSTKNLAYPAAEPLLIGQYPYPIIDELSARKEAAKKLYNIRKQVNFNEIAKVIIKKHASRKTRSKKI